jgi:hypothetical protein
MSAPSAPSKGPAPFRNLTLMRSLSKPHLVKTPGYPMWSCTTMFLAGFGKTPADAYTNWVEKSTPFWAAP